MNLLSIINIPIIQLENFSKSNSNRIGNGSFENYCFSFYPWIPSGVVKLETSTEEVVSGKNSVRFYPGSKETGKVIQRTRLLQVGELYVLLFGARSLGSPGDLHIEFGRRRVRVSKESLQSEYACYTFLFRSRSKFSYLHFLVHGNETEDIMIEVDAISLYPLVQLQKVLSFAV